MTPPSLRLWCFAGLLASTLIGRAASPVEPSIQPPDGAPVVVAHARQYDLTSRINGHVYRVFVSTPEDFDPARRYPVVYLLDGNWYFGPASINAAESGGTLTRAIIVGIGYPTDQQSVIHERRGFELTPTAPASDKQQGQHGGGDTLLRVIDEEIKPLVASRYPVDPDQQILYGKSFGGLAALRQLFRHPRAFSTYVIASPAIGFDDRAILQDEPGFAKQVRAGGLNLRILILAAGNEQYRGSDPAKLANDGWRMVDNAMQLADRLGALDPAHVKVEKAIIADEDHVSVSLAELGRGLTFALKP
jgi:predicted alpha/beta superfamily hydrolase